MSETPDSQNRDNRSLLNMLLPLVLAGVAAIGIWIGYGLSNNEWPEPGDGSTSVSFSKVEQILRYVDDEYVDTINREELVDNVIHSMLQELDPHSYYISARNLEGYTDPLEGNFDGVGIEFLIQKDTIVVVHALEGGPSKEKGILAGDRLIKVDGEKVAGVNISDQQIMQLLKGEKGTKVTMSVQRQGKNELIDYEVERDAIPIHSLDIAWMATPKTGYMKLIRFSKTTTDEFRKAAGELKSAGMEQLILDLRGNGGGVLEAAIEVADEFLEDGKLIVYTEGRKLDKDESFATSTGQLEDIEVIILIDGGSASASEILAGALQDNDVGTIIGRRSFGKGLVQAHKPLPDGSAFRLTVARYYTPTGRCIQKPYDAGHYDDYYGDDVVADSLPIPDSLIYVTPGGKLVYGGGGILPDLMVGIDTTGGSWYLSELHYRGMLNQFAFEYTDQHRIDLENFNSAQDFVDRFTITPAILEELYVYAEKRGIPRHEAEIARSLEQIKIRTKALIGRNLWQNDGYYPVILRQDKVFLRALEVLSGKED